VKRKYRLVEETQLGTAVISRGDGKNLAWRGNGQPSPKALSGAMDAVHRLSGDRFFLLLVRGRA